MLVIGVFITLVELKGCKVASRDSDFKEDILNANRNVASSLLISTFGSFTILSNQLFIR